MWNADTWFDGGTAVKSSVENIWRTQDQVSTAAAGRDNFAMGFPEEGIYELRLHFAETVYARSQRERAERAAAS